MQGTEIERILFLGKGIRRRPTLPGRCQPSTIGAERLNFCVRDGNRWDPLAIATGNSSVVRRLRVRTLKAAQEKLTLEASLPSFVFSDQALDLLVSASSYITAFTPLTYQPCRLQGVLPALAVAVLFSRWASRLDAFSVYPIRTSLPSYAVGTTTVTPEVRPSRSSRTRDSSRHDSSAHDG